jgi:L-lactate dehydrogenase complex protein LldG
VSAGRDAILAAVRRSLGRGPLDDATRRRLGESLATPRANLVPARVRLDHPALVDLFAEMVERADATVARVDAPAGVAGAVADFLAAEGLGSEIRMAPDPALDLYPWAERPHLSITRGRARDGDAVGLTGAFAGIAETGTCMLLSGPNSPTTLNFLVETHIVVVPAERIVGSYEDAWARLRRERARDVSGEWGRLPRTVNLITGPSRSADIEQKLQMGAHGPRRLHVVLTSGPRGSTGAPGRPQAGRSGPR